LDVRGAEETDREIEFNPGEKKKKEKVTFMQSFIVVAQ